jgi:Leucine-rich repeat (LRR) protein
VSIGAGDAQVMKMPGIRKIDLSSNQIKNPLPGIHFVPKGTYVNLQGNPLSNEARAYVVEHLGLDARTLSGEVKRTEKTP